MLNSTPKKAVILPSEEICQFHCVICGVEVSTKDRLSLFGRSKLDLKGAISQLLEGDLQITADQEHYICTKKCLSRVKKYLKLSSDLTQLSHELKQEILACNSVRIKRLNPPISPIQPITTTKEQSAAQRQSKAAKKSLFPSQTVEGTTVLLVTPISTPLLPPLSSQLPTVALSSETSIAAPIPHDPRHHAVISPPTQDNTATASRKNKETANNQDQEPSVEVRLNYPGCDKNYNNILKEDLEPLGKALARKVSYDKIATAIFRSQKLKYWVIKKILTNVTKECIGLCSLKEPSILRSKEPDEMKNFTLSKVNDEFKTRAPLFYSFLLSCATSGNKDEPMPSVAVAGSVLLRQRNVFMNATQSLISLMVKQNGVQKLLNRFNSMKLSLSPKSTLKRLDTYGLKFEEEVNKIKGKTSVNQPSTTTDIHASASRSEEVPDCHNSYKIVLDNIDLKILARDMTSERQNKDIHWCNHMAVKNRVVDQQNNKIQTDLLELDNSKILPEARDNQLLRGDYIQLVARILVEHLPCFKFLEKVCPKHIPHHYSKEMAEKSEKIPLGVLFKSENNNEEMVEILSEIQGYSNMRDQTTIPVVGDQLTVERGVNVIEALQNSYTPQERLEGVHMEVADWHSVVTFLKVIFNRHYSGSSDADIGTLYANRNVINRRNVVSDVHSAWAPCKTFMLIDLKARIIAAAMNLLDMKKLEEQPKKFVISEELKNKPDLVKQLYLHKLCIKLVDTFIIDQDLQKELMNKVLSNQEQEDIFDHQNLTADGRFMCRHEGCTKSFKYNGKSKKKHEMTHNQLKPTEIPALSSKYPEKSANKEAKLRDDAYNYNCSLLNHGLLFMNFLDATSEGDGPRLMRCWKFFLLHFKHEKSTYKYALEALYLQFQAQALLPPAQAFDLIHNRTVNNRGGAGRNVSLDLDLEHENNYLKQNIKALGPNVAPAPVRRICRAQKVTQTLLSNIDNECSIVRKSGTHVTSDNSKDLKAIIDVFVKEEVCTFTPGRHYLSFPEIMRDPLSALDMSALYKWINMHKKNIDLGRKAR